jgi:hypothetical protein
MEYGHDKNVKVRHVTGDMDFDKQPLPDNRIKYKTALILVTHYF